MDKLEELENEYKKTETQNEELTPHKSNGKTNNLITQDSQEDSTSKTDAETKDLNSHNSSEAGESSRSTPVRHVNGEDNSDEHLEASDGAV